MNIYIQKNNQQQGPFTLQEINAKLAAGEFLSEDPAWTEGWTDWQFVSDVPGTLCPPPPTPDVPDIPKPPQFRAKNMPPSIPVTPPPPTSKYDQYPSKAKKQLILSLVCLGISILAFITGYGSMAGYALLAGFVFMWLSEDYLRKTPAYVLHSFPANKLKLITTLKTLNWIMIGLGLSFGLLIQVLNNTVSSKTIVMVSILAIYGLVKLVKAIQKRN